MKSDVRYNRRAEAAETRVMISITGVHTGVLRRGDYHRRRRRRDNMIQTIKTVETW